MQKKIKHLIKIGINQQLFSLISNESIKIHSKSYLGTRIHEISQNNRDDSSYYSQLHALGEAVNNLVSFNNKNWVIKKISEICRKINNCDDEINIISYSAAELISTGLLAEPFDNICVLTEGREKTPDLSLGDKRYVEIYCPQESKNKITKIGNSYEKQGSMVSTTISYPITGTSKNSLTFPANKTILRVLNTKRSNDQTKEGVENILWLDLINGFKVSTIKLAPYESLNHAGHTFFGCFGIWHAFYGKKDISSFPPKWFELKFVNEPLGGYQQYEEGIFRERKSLSAALLLTTNGIVLFENPWASIPIVEDTKHSIKKIYKFRPEYSYFGCNKKLCEQEIDNILFKIDWLCGKN